MIYMLDEKTALSVLAIVLVVVGLCILIFTQRLRNAIARLKELEEESGYIGDDYEWLKLIAEREKEKKGKKK